MAKSNTTQTKERNDVYTAFAVLGLFLVFGFFILRTKNSPTEVVNEWIEQPVAPSSFSGYPYPHDDQSLENALPVIEEIAPLPQRAMRPVSTNEAATIKITEVKAAVLTEQAKENVEEVFPSIEDANAVVDSLAIKESQPSSELSPTHGEDEQKPVLQVEPQVKEKIAPVVPAVVPKVSSAKPKPAPTPEPEKGTQYITSEMPCVWVVGVFKNHKNVDRAVSRLRLNSFAAATGAHEKGTYVGVPCDCQNSKDKQAALRAIFSAQPWLLKK